MKVIVKHPRMDPEVTDVDGISAINKLIGNTDAKGNGLGYTGSDVREPIAPGIDIWVNANGVYNNALKGNLWSSDDMRLFCGTVVFAGYDGNNKVDAGACSLTEEQIRWCLAHIEKQKA